MRTAVLAAALALLPASAGARGWSVWEACARSSGAGGAGVVFSRRASAAAWNPALLAVPEHDGSVAAGAAAIRAEASYLYPEGAAAPSGLRLARSAVETGWLPHLCASTRIRRGWMAGLALTVPYAASIAWSDRALGERRRATVSVVALEPSVARRFRAFSLAAGLAYRNVEMTTRLDRPAVRQYQFERRGLSAGYRLAAAFEASERLLFAAVFRPRRRATLRGEATLWTPFAVARTKASSDVTLPAEAAVAGRARIGSVECALQLDWTGWSSLSAIEALYEPSPLWPASRSRDVVRLAWHDTVRPRAGVEAPLPGAVLARAGYAYDPSPIPRSTLSPTSLDVAKHVLTLGAGRSVGRLCADAAVQYWLGTPTEVRHASDGNEAVAGTYSLAAVVATVTLRYDW